VAGSKVESSASNWIALTCAMPEMLTNSSYGLRNKSSCRTPFCGIRRASGRAASFKRSNPFSRSGHTLFKRTLPLAVFPCCSRPSGQIDDHP